MGKGNSLTWGVNVTLETKKKADEIIHKIGGKNNKESFEKLLDMVDFQVARNDRQPELCKKTKELNAAMCDLRDIVRNIIELQEQEVFEMKNQKEQLEEEVEKLKEENKKLKKDNKELKKDIKYLKTIECCLSNINISDHTEKSKKINKDKEEKESEMLGQINLFDKI